MKPSRTFHLTQPTLTLILLLGTALAAHSDDARPEAEIVPDAFMSIEIARYERATIDQAFVATIGGRSGLVRWRDTTVFADGHVETILGTERRETDANQGSYHIELGADQFLASARITPFFHHVSRHALDRSKPEAVDWNVLGLRVDGPWPLAGRPALVGGLSVGHTTLASLIGYRWELASHFDARLLDGAHAALYCRGKARLVTTAWSERFPRDAFLDWSLELAARVARRSRFLEPFIAWEHRNDVFLTEPSARTRVLFGLRLAVEDRPRRNPAGQREGESAARRHP